MSKPEEMTRYQMQQSSIDGAVDFNLPFLMRQLMLLTCLQLLCKKLQNIMESLMRLTKARGMTIHDMRKRI